MVVCRRYIQIYCAYIKNGHTQDIHSVPYKPMNVTNSYFLPITIASKHFLQIVTLNFTRLFFIQAISSYKPVVNCDICTLTSNCKSIIHGVTYLVLCVMVLLHGSTSLLNSNEINPCRSIFKMLQSERTRSTKLLTVQGGCTVG